MKKIFLILFAWTLIAHADFEGGLICRLNTGYSQCGDGWLGVVINPNGSVRLWNGDVRCWYSGFTGQGMAFAQSSAQGRTEFQFSLERDVTLEHFIYDANTGRAQMQFSPSLPEVSVQDYTLECINLDVSPESGMDTQQSSVGWTFVRDTRYPRLGEAWRDPSGLVWGDLIKDSIGNVRSFSYTEAVNYCNSIEDARLPTMEEFQLLSATLGGFVTSVGYHLSFPVPYQPEILPNLDARLDTDDEALYPGPYLWSQTEIELYESGNYTWNSRFGTFGGALPDQTRFQLRCVK